MSRIIAAIAATHLVLAGCGLGAGDDPGLDGDESSDIRGGRKGRTADAGSSDAGSCPDDGNACLIETREGAECVTRPAADGAPCPGGSCQAGVCTPHAVPLCGDGACDAGETCSSCAADCGGCPASCGDGACNGGETCSSCAADCGGCLAVCGDGTCDGGETSASCAADCAVTGPGISSFTLLDASVVQLPAGSPLAGHDPMVEGQTITVAAGTRLSVRANALPQQVGSVRFDFDGAAGYRVENNFPYVLCSDDNAGGIDDCAFAPGIHTVTATAFTGSGASGAAGTPLTLSFTIAYSATCGDGACDGSESCSTCAADCGACPGVCGDSACGAGESCSSCPADCGACGSCSAVGNEAFSACFFANRTLTPPAVLERTDAAIDFDWGGSAPAPGLPADGFSVAWQGDFTFSAGSYDFAATADDGVRVYLDGALIVDAWRDQGASTFRASRDLSAGKHRLRYEYYEASGGAVARLAWTGRPAGIEVSPTVIALFAGGQQRFSARVTALGSSIVDWSVAEPGGGAIDVSGVYRAPSAAGTYHVVATSASDRTKFDTATVQVLAAPAAGASGFTTVVDGADTVKIYVSSSQGSDANDGRSPGAPKQTLRAGYSALRDGSADQLLLKRGDVWTVVDDANRLKDPSGRFSKTGRAFDLTANRELSGVLLIGAYGTGPRPKVVFPRNSGDFIFRGATFESKGRLAVVGLHFEGAPGGEWTQSAISWQGGDVAGVNASGFLIEDCRFTRLFRGYNFGDFTTIQVRRNVFEDIGSRCAIDLASYSPNMGWIGSGEGRPAYQMSKDILIEENFYVERFFDRTRYPGNREPYIQDSALYLAYENLQPIVVRRNLFINKGEFGPAPAVQLRPGGSMTDNLISGFSMAGGGPSNGMNAQPVHNVMAGNVVLDGVHLRHAPLRDAGGGVVRSPAGCDPFACKVDCTMIPTSEIDARAVGLGIGHNIPEGHSYTVMDNIVAHKRASNADGAGIEYGPSNDPSTFVRNVTFSRNVVYDWNGIGTHASGRLAGISLVDNEIQAVSAPGNEGSLIHTNDGGAGFVFSHNRYYTNNPGDLFWTGSWPPPSFAAFQADLEPTASWGLLGYPDPNRTLTTYAASIGLGPSLDALMDLMVLQSRDSWDARVTIDPILAYIRAGFGR